MEIEIAIALHLIVLTILILIIIAGAKIIGPTERGILLVNGQYRGFLKSGFRMVTPFSKVIKIDLSDQNWKNKLWENRKWIPLDVYEFEALEKTLEGEAKVIQKN